MKPRASPRAGLTDAQLTRLHARLEQKRDELSGRLRSTHERVGADHEALADPVDRAAVSEEDAEELGVADPDDRALGEIERALDRLQDGSYGLSEASGEPLGYDRLEAVPWATLSAQEQQLREDRSRGER